MPDIKREELQPLLSKLTITLTPEDYSSDLKKSLNKYAKQTNMRGFRKGKTPTSLIMKMYGKQALAELLEDKFDEAIQNYVNEHIPNNFLRPLPVREAHLDVAPREKKNYTTEILVGEHAPVDFQYSSITVDAHEVSISDEELQEMVDAQLKRMGSQVEVSGDLQEEDLLDVRAVEADPAEDQEPHEHTFKVTVEDMTDAFKAKAMEAGIDGEAFEHDIYDVDSKLDDDQVRAYLLGMDGDEDNAEETSKKYHFTIVGGKRVQSAQLDDEFVDKLDDPDIDSPEDFTNSIRKQQADFYDKQSRELAKGQLYNQLDETVEMEFSDEFLRQWIERENNGEVEDMDAKIAEYKKDLRWVSLAKALAQDLDIEVQPSEISDAMYDKVASYFGPYAPQEQVDQIMQSLLGNQEMVMQEFLQLRMSKVLDKLIDQVTLNKQEVSQKEMDAIIKAHNEKMQAEIDAEDDLEEVEVLDDGSTNDAEVTTNEA